MRTVVAYQIILWRFRALGLYAVGMEASVIIPSYQSNETLPSCLRSILNQAQFSEHKLQIVVVDSSPEPLSSEYEKTFKKVQFIRSSQRLYAGAARNLGAHYAKHELLVFLDCDCLWSAEWLKSASKLLKQYPEALAFNGPVLYQRPQAHWGFYLHLFEFHEWCSQKHWHPRFLHSGNLVIKKAFFDQSGGFRENLPMCNDFSFAASQLKTQQKKLHFHPSLVIYHQDHLQDQSKIFDKCFNMGWWRARVDREVSEHLQISNRPWFNFFTETQLQNLFWAAILGRSYTLKSYYRASILRHCLKLRKLCQIWARGFRQARREMH